MGIQSMVEQLYLLLTEYYKKGKKRYFFGQNLIFDSVPKCIKMTFSQKHITLGQTRTAENPISQVSHTVLPYNLQLMHCLMGLE